MLTIVGIGASAGGLEAILALLSPLQKAGRASYIIAQHQMVGSEHTELLLKLLRRETALSVQLATPGLTLAADTVYLLPAGQEGRVQAGRLSLQPTPDRVPFSPSIDILFESIARDCGGRGVGVLLSGTGLDGVAGCRALQRRGGRTLAQDPGRARFPGMPRAAIEAGVIDALLDPADPGALGKWGQPDSAALTPPASDDFSALLLRLRQATGLDFSPYKEATLRRRLDRRILNLGLADLGEYRRYLESKPQELQALRKLFFVSLSSFFRDPEAFACLAEHLEAVLRRRPPHEPIRIWCAGCATGEEAYSLAILLAEMKLPAEIAVTAGDLNEDALEKARAGIYPMTKMQDLPPELLERYFEVRGDSAQVRSIVRDRCRFELQDVLERPPAATYRLISCRNLLIYLQADAQRRLLNHFSHALEPSGLLFLGPSETTGQEAGARFRPVHKLHRIYQLRSKETLA